jgi:Ca2+-transporting ATPase
MTTTNYKGLTSKQAEILQQQFGKNELLQEKKQSLISKVFHIVLEPMFLLLIIAATIYFILGEPRDGAIMLIFVVGIISIDVVQQWKTDKTLNALKNLSAPHIKVIRDNKEMLIESINLVPGDLMVLSEGDKIPADGIVVKANDLCVDESSLTGESVGVWKTVRRKESATKDYWKKDYCYAGTFVTQGSGYIIIKKIGINTEYGKIGKSVAEAKETPSPLKIQTDKLVKLCAGIAAVLFALVSGITYLNISEYLLKDRIIDSILSGITLAMAMIPEEFPVILTVFLSMGAWRLAKQKSLVRKLPAVETLGAISVLCVDKTGTITQNQMTVTEISINTNKEDLIKNMGMACETDAYDPMEKSMLLYCEKNNFEKEKLFSGKLINEYAFTNELKMMGHIWENNGKIQAYCKGSPEKILALCNLNKIEKENTEKQIIEMSKKGLRVIAIGHQYIENTSAIPKKIENCNLVLDGLIGLQDPPRDSVKEDIEKCIKAGIRIVMITGDNGITASSIAKQVGIPNADNIITGDMLEVMTDSELQEKVKTVSIFSRVIPEHKMRIVKAFKSNGEIVAMTGDGVNDAPALKYADIGIAMGKRGSEVSREAADLILLDDNFSTIVNTIKDGRRIFDNIKKAVGYVFSIHIPIAFASLLAPLLAITSNSLLFLPLHVVLLELIIDPTCSIVLERQPAENNIMERKPRNVKDKLLTSKSLTKSVIQGIVIFAASFGVYYFTLKSNSAEVARSMGLTVLMISNILLVQVNNSNYDFVFKTAKKLIKDKIMWIINIATIIMIFVILYSPLNNILNLSPLSFSQLSIVLGISVVSVLWYEIIKAIKKSRQINHI